MAHQGLREVSVKRNPAGAVSCDPALAFHGKQPRRETQANMRNKKKRNKTDQARAAWSQEVSRRLPATGRGRGSIYTRKKEKEKPARSELDANDGSKRRMCGSRVTTASRRRTRLFSSRRGSLSSVHCDKWAELRGCRKVRRRATRRPPCGVKVGPWGPRNGWGRKGDQRLLKAGGTVP